MAQNYINKINIDSTQHLIEPTLYVVPTLNDSAYTASLDNFALVNGATIQAKFTTTNPANATLNVNSTGAKNLYYEGSTIAANAIKVNHIYTLVYDSSLNSDTGGWQISGNNLQIGTNATDAMAGDTTVTNVRQGASTTDSWRKILLSYNTYAAYNTAVGNPVNGQVYSAVGVSVKPSTGSIKVSGSITANTLSTNALTITDTTGREHINFSRTGDGHNNPNYINMPASGTLAFSIGGAGGNNIVAMIDSNGIIPFSNNTKSIGTSTYKWNAMYANTFYGDLEGAAKTLANYYTAGIANRIDDLNLTHVTNGGMIHFKVSANTTHGPEGAGNILHFYWDTNEDWGSQLCIPSGYTDRAMQYRSHSSTSQWGDWRTLLDSSNYSSYALPLSGGSMSGNIIFSTANAAYDSNGIQFNNNSTKKANIGCDNNGTLGFYATKISLRPVLNSSTDGIEITTAAMTPTKSTMNLGSSTNKWNTVYATTFDGNATSASALQNQSLSISNINSTSGSFAFSATGIISDIYSSSADWIGLQIGDSVDKWQLTAISNRLYFRQNDSGGTNTSWNSWTQILSSSTTFIGDVSATFENNTFTTTIGNDKITTAMIQDTAITNNKIATPANSNGKILKSISNTAGNAVWEDEYQVEIIRL